MLRNGNTHSARSGRSLIAALAGSPLVVLVLLSGKVEAQDLRAWRLAPEVRMGQDDGSGLPTFTRIISVLPMSDGSVVIADAANREIHIYGPEGEYSHSVGRDGRGPGEFERLTNVGLLGDTLWVLDSGERRITLFSRDGTHLATTRYALGRSSSGLSDRFPTAVVPGGVALGSASASLASGKAFQDVRRPILLMTLAGEMLDTLAWVPTEHAHFVLKSDGGYTFGPQLFTDAGLTVVPPSSTRFFIVDRSVATTERNAVFHVTAIETSGDTLWNRSYTYAPKPVEKARADSLLDAQQRRGIRSGYSPGEIRDAVFLPDYYTPITSGVAGSDGKLWLRREEGQPTVEYWILGIDGTLLATVSVPSNLTLMAATDSVVWGIETDEYDVPTVVRYRIER